MVAYNFSRTCSDYYITGNRYLIAASALPDFTYSYLMESGAPEREYVSYVIRKIVLALYKHRAKFMALHLRELLLCPANVSS